MQISIIIPCYNSENTIDDCINSVFSQTYKDLEIICINDGSSDDTLNKLNALKLKSPFPFFIIDEENKGACFARNQGLNIAKGDYVQFLDADDMLLPEKIEHQVKLISETQCVIIIAAYNKNLKNKKNVLILPEVSDKWEALIKGRAGCTCSNLFSKKILLEIKGWNENYKSSQEIELMFRMFQKTNSIIYDKLSHTIINERSSGSISSSMPSENWERAILLRIRIWEYLKENNLINEKRENELKKIIFDCIRILYSFDKTKANNLFQQFVKDKFKPVKSIATSKLYIFTYSLFGFKSSQMLYAFFK